jgi:hypothetical protein
MNWRLIAALALGVFVLTVAVPLVIASNAVAQSTKGNWCRLHPANCK